MREIAKWQHRDNPPRKSYPCLVIAHGGDESDERVAGRRVFLASYDTHAKEWLFSAEYGLMLKPSGCEMIKLFPGLRIIAWRRIFCPTSPYNPEGIE